VIISNMTALLCGSSQTHLGTEMPSADGYIIRAGGRMFRNTHVAHRIECRSISVEKSNLLFCRDDHLRRLICFKLANNVFKFRLWRDKIEGPHHVVYPVTC